MRIKQVCYPESALSIFTAAFKEKYKLTYYSSDRDPAIFFGCFGNYNFRKIIKHKGLAVVIWAGTDALRQLNNPNRVRCLDRPNIKHIAISDFIEEDLKRAGLKYKRINVTPIEHIRNPKPLGDSVYFYHGMPRPNYDPYNYYMFSIIREEMPNINFISIIASTYEQSEMNAIYEKCFINLRLTLHDGLSNTVSEMGMMGRRSVWNNTFPGAYRWNNKEDIKYTINTEYKNRGTTYLKLIDEVEKYLDTGTDWLDTNYWLK